jgi:FkbM family methyltransferase
MVCSVNNNNDKQLITKQFLSELVNRVRLYSVSSLPKYIIDLVGFRLPIVRKKSLSIHFRYKLKNGVTFVVRPFKFDRYIIDEIFLERAYFPDRDFELKDGDVVVDVGAHIGVFTIYSAKNADCTVYSYEPRPDNFELLKENVSLNKIEACVKTFQFAVGGVSGSLEFCMDAEGLGQIGGFTGSKIIVRTVTLKEIFDSNNLLKVDFLKIDVEGEELEMLLNFPKEYFPRIEKIAMESHTESITSQLTSYLSSNGFSVRTLKLPKSNMSMLYAKNNNYYDCLSRKTNMVLN